MQESQSLMSAQFDPKATEQKWYQFWLEMGFFKAENNSKKPKYVMMMPPPNVTGVLHIGHALTSTLEDILTRWKRMQGFNTLWLPGTDHAGIATQMVVERQLLKEEKKSKHDLGREKFLEKVWEWKEKSQETILSQLKLIGSSCDWSRIKFTLDPEVSEAVKETFVRLYNENLIYRDLAMIQWCPRCRTVLSDLEVKPKEIKGKLWHLKYFFKEEPKKYLVVATTRPETIFADVAVAVNPEDERYRKYIGKEVLIPLLGKTVPVIADGAVDKTFGTGVLKITPAHDLVDYEVGKRHGLPTITIFDEGASLNENAHQYRGMTREKAIEKITEDLMTQELIEKEVEHNSLVGHCDRCATRLEPWLSYQWFVKAEELAKEAIQAVEQKKIKIIPETWEKTYFDWMRNIRPWCISRQLWWGHRIPAWHCLDCRELHVAKEAPVTCSKCQSARLKQEEDVLDTWFSSGLWPFSTLGWPKESVDFKDFYPTDVLETGFDILFFWVARMIMLGIKMTGKIPFSTVYLHPMVRDEFGQKMSKTKGNVKDPLDIIGKIGADPLRFTLAAMAVHGRDVLLSDSRIEGYRNFVNKIWNASRFMLLNFPNVSERKSDLSNPINQWIWSRLNETAKGVNESLEQYRFFDACEKLYHFVWHDYCDWFIELIKEPEELERRKENRDSTALEVLESALKLLHPFMPFVTEEIYQNLPLADKAVSISIASFPQAQAQYEFSTTAATLNSLIKVVEAVRSQRASSGLTPAKEIDVTVEASSNFLTSLKPFEKMMTRLCRSRFSWLEKMPSLQGQILIPLESCKVFIPIKGLVDVDKEKLKVQKEIDGINSELERADQKLSSEQFMSSAPPAVIQGVRDRHQLLLNKVNSLRDYLKELENI